jgi:phage terminase large subunit-like protein
MEWTTALPDWEKPGCRRTLSSSLQAAVSRKRPLAALDVFKALRVVDVAGSPTFGEAGDDWIFDIVAVIFGAYDASAGKRLIREFFLCVSKKNGKSTFAAAVMLTA